MKKLFKVVVNYKYNAGGYKDITYWFENEEQYETFLKKQYSDERIRKVITLKRTDNNDTIQQR